MRNLSVVAIIVSSLAFFGARSTASGGTVRLDGIADGSTIYIEEQSDAFFRMDLFDPPPRKNSTPSRSRTGSASTWSYS